MLTNKWAEEGKRRHRDTMGPAAFLRTERTAGSSNISNPRNSTHLSPSVRAGL